MGCSVVGSTETVAGAGDVTDETSVQSFIAQLRWSGTCLAPVIRRGEMNFGGVDSELLDWSVLIVESRSVAVLVIFLKMLNGGQSIVVLDMKVCGYGRGVQRVVNAFNEDG